MTAGDLALVLDELGERPEAEAPLEEALAIFEASLETGHPHIAGCRANLSAVRGT